MNVVDSSAWLEFFSDGPNAATFAPAIEHTSKLLVPSICLFEVFKRVFQQRGEGAALQAVVVMHKGTNFDGLPDVRFVAKRPGHAPEG